MYRTAAFSAFFFAILGCNPQPTPPPTTPTTPGTKVHVDAPGVNVDVDRRDKKVDVQAPGVKINIERK